MKYKIEKGIKMERPKTCSKYPFRDMSVGDSIIVSKIYSRDAMTKYSNASRNFGKKQTPIMKFSLRKVEGGAIRLWRIK